MAKAAGSVVIGPSKKILAIGLAVAIVGIVVWLSNLRSNPETVFYRMVENSMRTNSVIKEITQSNDSQSLKQTIYFQTGANNFARAQAVLSQRAGSSQDNNEITTKVTTESIGTPYEDYVRYLSIETNQKTPQNKPLDFTAVIGIWGRAADSNQDITQTSGELFSQTVLGVVPTGYIEKTNRDSVLDKIRAINVYEVDFSNVERTEIDNRNVYKYRVKMQPKHYVEMLKIYAEAFGLEQLRQVDAQSFGNSPSLEFDFVVDISSGQLLQVHFLDSNRTETFSSYGAEVNVEVPDDSVPVEELQRRLQSIGDT